MGKPLTKGNIKGGANPHAFIDATIGSIEAIIAGGELPAYPPPIGVITEYAKAADGESVVMRNQAGSIFVASFQGILRGPVTSKNKPGYPSPTFEELVASSRLLTAHNTRIGTNVPGTGIPVGTLPGGLEWTAPPEGGELENPNGTVDMAGAGRGGLSLPMILGLAGAAWLALKG